MSANSAWISFSLSGEESLDLFFCVFICVETYLSLVNKIGIHYNIPFSSEYFIQGTIYIEKKCHPKPFS